MMEAEIQYARWGDMETWPFMKMQMNYAQNESLFAWNWIIAHSQFQVYGHGFWLRPFVKSLKMFSFQYLGTNGIIDQLKKTSLILKTNNLKAHFKPFILRLLSTYG